jgi:hypothetical protein
MKKNLFFILLLFLITDTFCQTFVSTVPENKNVILEEFTGLMCTYCPDGHLIANQIKSSNQDDFFTINIHEGYYAVWPNRADYTTNIGNAITNLFPAHGHPSGVVNRGSVVLGRGQWAGAVNSTIGQSSYVNVAAKSTIDLLSRELTVEVEAYYTGNGSGQNNINCIIAK